MLKYLVISNLEGGCFITCISPFPISLQGFLPGYFSLHAPQKIELFGSPHTLVTLDPPALHYPPKRLDHLVVKNRDLIIYKLFSSIDLFPTH